VRLAREGAVLVVVGDGEFIQHLEVPAIQDLPVEAIDPALVGFQ
jgi:hypothetical protein